LLARNIKESEEFPIMAGTLTFQAADVQRLIDVTKAAKEHRGRPYEDDTPEPGLWLVGDDGVYLMTNRKLGQGEKPEVVYAQECPSGDFHAKRQIFGGDDGAEFLPVEDCEKWVSRSGGPTVFIKLSPEQLELLS
jgi:hypothetical protein